MSSAPHTALFREVDRSGDPDFFGRFMDEANSLNALTLQPRRDAHFGRPPDAFSG